MPNSILVRKETHGSRSLEKDEGLCQFLITITMPCTLATTKRSVHVTLEASLVLTILTDAKT